MTLRKAIALAIGLLAVLTAVVSSIALLSLEPAVAAENASAALADPGMVRSAFLAAALATALAALAAGYAVARVGSAAVGALAEKPELFGRVLVLVGLAEGIAIYGLIVSILILNRVS
jgi:V/A-type H+/Na+-transporting ATPase subunit K